MEWTVLGIALLAGVFGAWKSLQAQQKVERLQLSVDVLEAEKRRLRQELEGALSITRGHLALVAQGQSLDPAMIQEGMPFADLSAAQVRKVIQETPERFVLLDVRTREEYSRGHLEGAQLLPVQELERRLSELPGDRSTELLVYCQAGGRSAAACELLAHTGYTRLFNMSDGFGAWAGPVKRPENA